MPHELIIFLPPQGALRQPTRNARGHPRSPGFLACFLDQLPQPHFPKNINTNRGTMFLPFVTIFEGIACNLTVGYVIQESFLACAGEQMTG